MRLPFLHSHSQPPPAFIRPHPPLSRPPRELTPLTANSTTVPTPHLNGKHTVFGAVVAGSEFVQAIEGCGSASGKPSEEVRIVRCGTV